jgi:D-aminoacyl-tRNA deacylase
MKVALLKLESLRIEKNLDYKVSMEVTHHGPTSLKKPVLFVEVGSTKKEWEDPEAIEGVSKAALSAAENKTSYEKGVGLGGNHYAPRHTKFILGSESSLGHLIPSYALDSLDLEMFEEAFTKSKATFCFLDWKGMKKGEREKVIRLAKDLNLKVRKNISTASELPKSYKTFTVNADLFALAERTDPKKLREVMISKKVVPTERNGHLQPQFSAPGDIRSMVIETCLEILKSKNPFLSGDKLIFEQSVFDPIKAKVLGLKPGPDYASLKKGLNVNAGERVITPGDVLGIKRTEIKLDPETVQFLKKKAL